MECGTRARLVKLEVDRLASEAKTASPERVAVILVEMDLLHDSLLDIFREQLAAQLERDRPKPGRRWWKRRYAKHRTARKADLHVRS